MTIEELEEKYGFKQGQYIFLDGGAYHKDECGKVSYQEGEDAFFYEIVHSSIHNSKPIGTLIRKEDDLLWNIEKMDEKDVPLWGKA